MTTNQHRHRKTVQNQTRVVLAVLLSMSVFAACSATETTTPSPTASNPVIPTAPPEPTIAWKPAKPMKKIKMSEEEKHAARLADLNGEAKAMGITNMIFPPLVRWIYPEEIAAVTVPCLAEKGFKVKAAHDGYGISGNTGGQDIAFGRARLECQAQYTIDPTQTQKQTPEQWERDYDYITNFLIPCVRAHGYQIKDMPSKETWVANPTPVEGYPQIEAIEKECPYNMPSKYWAGDD